VVIILAELHLLPYFTLFQNVSSFMQSVVILTSGSFIVSFWQVICIKYCKFRWNFVLFVGKLVTFSTVYIYFMKLAFWSWRRTWK